MGASPVQDVFASAAATAQALTVNYAATTYPSGSNIRVADTRAMIIYWTTSGTAPTSFDWRICGSNDAGTTWFSECATEVAVGVVTHQEIVRHLTDDTGAAATGMTIATHVDLSDCGFDLIRIEAKRTAGDATTALLGQAQFISK